MSTLAHQQHQAAPTVNHTEPTEDGQVTIGVEELGELMRYVNQTTEQLQATHTALHEQVQRLQGELAEANAQLRRSQSLAALGEMAAGIAHEIRNPLASINLYAQTLSDELSEQPEQAAICTKIHRAVNMLDGIVRDVLLFARDVQISPGPTTTGELIDRATTACESLVVNDDITVIRPSERGRSHELQADTGLLTQAMGNVIRNAIEAMAEHGSERREVRISAERRMVRCPDGARRRRIMFRFADTGPGIPDEVIDRMFNPFFTTRKTGTGLGLAIVNRITEAHGGHVNVRNREEGGAEVAICVPEKARQDEAKQ